MKHRFYTKIETPCTVDWDTMKGDDQIRFCSQCKLNVYNLTELTDNEITKLYSERPAKRRCVRILTRADGSIMTANCPKYLRKIRTLLLKRAPWVLILMSMLTTTPQAKAQGTDAFAVSIDSTEVPVPKGTDYGRPGTNYAVGATSAPMYRAPTMTGGIAGPLFAIPTVNQSSSPPSLPLGKLAAISALATMFMRWRNRAARRKAVRALQNGACSRDLSGWLPGWHVGFGIGAVMWLSLLALVFVVWVANVHWSDANLF